MGMTRMWQAALVVGIALSVMGTVVESAEDGCDMKTVEKAFYCEPCKAVLVKKELLSSKKYFECESCKQVSPKSKCKACGKKCAKKVTDKGVCPKCFGKPVEAEACVKTGYVCPKCGDVEGKPAKCEACKATYKKVPVRAVIHYRCAGCAKTAATPGNCENAECEQKGKPLVRTCSRSGKAPHVQPAGKDKKKSSGKKREPKEK